MTIRRKTSKRKSIKKTFRRCNPHSFPELRIKLLNDGWKVHDNFYDVLISPDKRFSAQLFDDAAYLNMLDKKDPNSILFDSIEINNRGMKVLEQQIEDLTKLEKLAKKLKSFIED